MAKKITITSIIDNNRFVFTAEETEGVYLDTKVELNGIPFCWITFSDHKKFIREFSSFIGKFSI
jgi:hypothetical protein